MSKTRPKVFVILTGVSGNLGDAVIRRRVLEWSRGLGPIHAYVGRTTDGWNEQLGFASGERVYRAAARRQWLRNLLFGRGGRVLVFDPGEVPLGREHLKSELMFLLVVLGVRLRGGFVFRPPRAVGDFDPLVGRIYRWSSRLSQVVLWRERRSLERIPVGKLIPDTAFAEPAVDGSAPSERSTLLISMRGKRSAPRDPWFEGIRAFAASQDYRIVTMSQVDEDEERNREIALRFGSAAEHVSWTGSDLDQERAIRDRYRECSVVVSDRLHVLILSAQAGALPTEIADSPKPKVEDHFATIGYHGVTLPVDEASAEDIEDFLARSVTRRGELRRTMEEARFELSAEIERFRERCGADGAHTRVGAM